MEFKADLHCHSTCSDGTFTPSEILDLAKEIGLSGLSITDHDTVEAYTDSFFGKAKELKIKIITGVEFSCQVEQFPVHILGYNFSLDSQELCSLCERHKTRRIKRNEAILYKLQKLGFDLSVDELKKSDVYQVIGRPHIAALLRDKGYVETIDEAFKRYIGEGRPAYDPGEAISVEESIEIIKQAKGKVFIAHPHLINRNKVLEKLLRLPFDGIESFYGTFSALTNLKWVEIARKYKMLSSGGSDFHGAVKPKIPLGASFTNQEAFNKIRG